MSTTRREFLAKLSGSALAMSLGPSLFPRLTWADDDVDRISFGALEPLVAVMTDTPLEQFLPTLVAKLRAGVALEDLVAAGALANVRTFGGDDYVGFHTMAAMMPAYAMALELPEAQRPLPVLKVLYRNTARIHETGRAKKPALRIVPAADAATPESLRASIRGRDLESAERQFARLAGGKKASEAIEQLLPAIEDLAEVHRAVMAYRAYDLLHLTGEEHAHLLLRQSVRYCVKSEQRVPEKYARSRELLPQLLEEFHLAEAAGTKKLDDVSCEELARAIFEAPEPAHAARTAAKALADGLAPDQLGEAISVAANQLLLRDHGRTARDSSSGKPEGSVHGDSIGVHGCDSANAWRNLARVAGPRNRSLCLVLSAFQVALDRENRGGDFLHWGAYPLPEHLEKVKTAEPGDLDEAIRSQDQALAAAIVHRSGELGHDHAPLLDVMRRFAISEDGALHAEKYYRTVTDEIAANRPAFRTRQLVALARVTASECGKPAPGVAEAKELLG